PNTALTRQEQTAQDLDRLARDLDRAIDLARDPREAARQLARLQEDLKNRTQNEARATPLDRMTPEKLEELRKDQDAIKQAARRLSVPDASKEAQLDQKAAIEHAQKAAEELAKKDQVKAEANMNLAKQALERLAEKLPTLDKRLAAAREEVAKLRRQQEEIARQAEPVAKAAEQIATDADKGRREVDRKSVV